MESPSAERRKPNTVSAHQDEHASSSSPLTRSCPYDVFLSFRGVDTRNNFTGHLHSCLVQKGIKTFIDDEELRKGEEISSALLKAIEGSKISLVIFSENYASSSWCLDELDKNFQCKKLGQQLVYPVFYKVEPSDVRYQNGKYSEALAKHESRLMNNMNKVKRWRTALREAATLSGWTFSDGHEAKFISKIAEEISAQIAIRSCLNVAKYPVGIESRVQDMLELLDVGGSDVRMAGIWGTAGIGKTTVAKGAFNLIRHKFEGWCFLANVRETSKSYQGLVQLQNRLLHEILRGWKMEIIVDADRGIELIKDRLGSKRVLIVLDDVNELNQLDKLAGGLDWFGRGSRIIITTRDKSLLNSHQVYAIYTAEALENDEARNLLIMNAFKENRNPDEFEKFPIDTALLYAHGLPLAINVLGSSLLCRKSIKEWHDTIDHFSRSPNKEIQTILVTSYNELGSSLKEAFLDIACFLKGRDEKYVMQALDGSRLNPAHAIKELEEKALINIDQLGRIWMHDLLEEMGKEIVYEESPIDAGKRSRLWFHEDVYRVLTENTGSKKLKGIIVELPGEDEICLSAKCFKKMKNLQLFININARLSGEVNYLPNQLRFVHWLGYPAQSLPSDFNPRKLVNLNVSNGRISRFPQGLQNLQNMKSLIFRDCEFLTLIPDLTGMFPNLEKLDLTSCPNLAELHPSVGSLDRLVDFYLKNCYNLKMFPKIVNMKSLQNIDFKGCKSLENFPEIEGRMESLTHMDISRTVIKEVPSSIGYDLFNLQCLKLQECENLVILPLSIYELQRLVHLELTDCSKLVLPFPNKVKYLEAPTPTTNSKIPYYGNVTSSERESHEGDADGDDQGYSIISMCPSLEYFDAGGCNISDCDFLVTLDCASNLDTLDFSKSNLVSLPPCLATKYINLYKLCLNGCKRLQEIPELPPNLELLEVKGCVSLERISKLSNILKRQESKMLEWLDMTDCCRLRDNLVQEAEKNFNHQVKADLFSLFLSHQKSEFGIVFPASHDEIPKWFSSRMDSKGNGAFEFDIQVLPNFQWHNTGLALCVAGEKVLDCVFEIRINGATVTEYLVNDGDSPLMVLHYVPLHTIPSEALPPFICRVTIRARILHTKLKSCGVHLVMPPNEECMKLSHAQQEHQA